MATTFNAFTRAMISHCNGVCRIDYPREGTAGCAVYAYERHFRMSVWDDFIHRLKQDLAKCREDLELLESGQLQHRERRGDDPWVDTTVIPMGHLQDYLNLKGYKEFDAEHRASGWNAWLTLAISPAAPSETPPKASPLMQK